MVRSDTGNARGSARAAKAWKSSILRATVVGMLPILSIGCAQKVQQKAEFGKWSAADRPMVLSSRPNHDSIVNDATEEQLSEADWRVLQALGPKAIWDRIAEMNKSSRDRKKLAGDATTKPTALAKVGSSTKPALTAKEIGEQTPTIPLPDGKIRMIYALRNYGGTTISATTDGNTARRNVQIKAPDLAPLVTALAT